MKMIRKSGAEDVVSLDKSERMALQKTITICRTLAEPKWAEDQEADKAVVLLVSLADRYDPNTENATDGN